MIWKIVIETRKVVNPQVYDEDHLGVVTILSKFDDCKAAICMAVASLKLDEGWQIDKVWCEETKWD